MEKEQLFIILLIILLAVLFITIFILISTTSTSEHDRLIPSKSTKQVDCSTVMTLCNPNDENPCGDCQGPEQMKCVRYNDKNVCLPSSPDNSKCNPKYGGIHVWTGYGFADEKGWSCLCSHPELFAGANCDTPNPSYCSNGTLDITDLNHPICSCPPSTNMLYRTQDNSPFCVSTDERDGGGMFGLYGNYVASPDWRNVYYNNNDKKEWAKNIQREFNIGSTKNNRINDEIDILSVLESSSKNELTNDIVSALKTKLCNNQNPLPLCQKPFPENVKPEISYTYYQNVYFK